VQENLAGRGLFLFLVSSFNLECGAR